MPNTPTQEYLNELITELRKLSREKGWDEFKENNPNPGDIGEHLRHRHGLRMPHPRACYLFAELKTDEP